MRFLSLVRVAETGQKPSERLMAEMGKLIEEMTGKGVLIVTGDADLTNITWRGLVLVGGVASVSGNATRVFGTLITGLNVKLGYSVDDNDVNDANGNQ